MKTKFAHYKLQMLVVAFSFLFSSCEKVIQVNPKDAPPQYVIEANLSDEKKSLTVTITQTTKTNDPIEFNYIKDAYVTISQNAGVAQEVKLSNDQQNYTAQVNTSPGSKYDLSVELDNVVYTASCRMPKKVPLDSLYITPVMFLGKLRFVPTVVFKDPPEPGNNYRFIVGVDGFTSTTIFTLSDKFLNGNILKYELQDFFTADDAPTYIDLYDYVDVEMRSIDKPILDYYTSLSQSSTGQPQTASPDNPVSNFSGGALGYFSVHTFDTARILNDSTYIKAAGIK